MRTLEEVREFFKNDVYASGTTGIEIEDARPGYAKVTLKIDERHIFLGAAKGKMLIGEAEVVKDGRATSFYKVRITDELGTKIAEVSTNGYKLPARS